MMKFRGVLALIAILAAVTASSAEPQSIILASTTSVEASGLLAHILPQFTAKTGITVNVVAQGTGKALDTARRGDADLLLVHDPEAEQHFMDEGHGGTRRQIAWNDFIIVGPSADPAHVKRRPRQRRRLESDCRLAGPLRVAWRQERHQCRRAAALEGRRPDAGHPRQGEMVSRHRRRHGPGAQCRERDGAPTRCPTAAPGSASTTRDR